MQTDKKRKLTKNQALMAAMLEKDANWKSPVKVFTTDQVQSLAQFVNSNGGEPVKEMIVSVEYSREWQDAILLDWDMEKDKKDPKNFGYWHFSRAYVQILKTGQKTWMPFSMIQINLVTK